MIEIGLFGNMIDPLKAERWAGAQRARHHEDGTGKNEDQQNLDRKASTFALPSVPEFEQYDEKEEQRD